ncbi:exopolysaccharide biosynthesis polyprenyl glycosylphosphotransferase [Roseomonas sp. BN140053]|uniref:exopolysaccharide biosynthesis polyprenyl glycosylphosphotransferase n=1 Tax=Roseomonas sp. BN140053 TaxID=3391898 RepID=UPI0039E769DD
MTLASPSPIHHAELPRNITDYTSLPPRLNARHAARAWWYGVTVGAADLSAAVLCLAIALLAVWPSTGGSEQSLLATARASLAVPAVLLGGVMAHLAAGGHYSRRIPFGDEVRQLMLTSFVGLLCHAAVLLMVADSASWWTLPILWSLFPACALALRSLGRYALALTGRWHMPVLIVGENAAAQSVTSALLSDSSLGYDVVSTIRPSDVSGRHWRGVMNRFRAELLVLAPGNQGRPDRLVAEALMRERIPFTVAMPFDGLPVVGATRTTLSNYDFVAMHYRNNLSRPVSRAVKVVFDVTVTSLGLLLLLPLLAIIAVLVKRDGGPVFFAHTRIGASGRPFKCLKFRSMVLDSDAALQQVLRTDPKARAEWNETQKLRDDPRITWIGRYLRRTSLDELPQLFNVLRLEMSLVGPRPIVEAEVARYDADIAYYYQTRPGLTGLWQISGRTETSYAQRVQLDSWYVKNWTLWHDLVILLRTVPAVLKSRGAY